MMIDNNRIHAILPEEKMAEEAFYRKCEDIIFGNFISLMENSLGVEG